jgi:SAM-dependent methyltransferase
MKAPGVPWKVYLRNGFGQRFSRLGQRFGSQWMTYNPLVMQQFHDSAVENAPRVVNALTTVFPSVKRVLDVGAGSGAFAAEFQRRGCTVVACEHSEHGRKLAIRQGVESRAFDLTQTPPCAITEEFDLVYSFEVAEHVPPDLGLKLVQFLAKFPAPIVFTAAQPGQGGTGHINEQPPSYWRRYFADASRPCDERLSELLSQRFRAEKAAEWFHRNVLVFNTSC